MKNWWVLDIETHINYILIGIKNVTTNKVTQFEAWKYKDKEVNNLYQFLKFVQYVNRNNGQVFGYMSLGFDYKVIHPMLIYKWLKLPTEQLINKMYEKSQEVVNQQYVYTIWESNWFFPNRDLYFIWHFNNQARRSSLKALEIAMNMETVEDLPYKHNDVLDYSKKEKVRKYNINDLNATHLLLQYTIGDVEHPLYKGKDKLHLREAFGKKYGLNLKNKSDVGIGKEIFIKFISDATGKSRKEVKNNKTYRNEVKLKECLPNIEFDNKLFKIGYKVFQNKTIEINSFENTKEDKNKKSIATIIINDDNDYIKIPCFSKDETQHLYNVLKSYQPIIKEGESKSKKGFSIIINKVKLNYGLGGLHGCINSNIIKSNDDQMLVDLDVSGFYVSMAIKEGYEPEHLSGFFTDIYKHKIKDERDKAKFITFDSVTNMGLKLAGNGAFGLSKEVNSPLYDPKYTYSVTLTGMIYITLLIEWLYRDIPNMELIQANTDGITVLINKENYDKLLKVWKQWENKTGLELEEEIYEAMYIRDVNNYIAVWKDKKEVDEKVWLYNKNNWLAKCTKEKNKYYIQKIKYKGAYEVWKELHKDNSMKIIRIAVFDYLIYDVPIEKTIKEHKDIYNFYKRYKATAGHSVHLDRIINNKLDTLNLSKNVRYYISKKGGTLYKLKNGKKTKIDINVTLFNKYFESDNYNIDYDYYIRQAKDLVKDLKSQQTLF